MDDESFNFILKENISLAIEIHKKTESLVRRANYHLQMLRLPDCCQELEYTFRELENLSIVLALIESRIQEIDKPKIGE